MPDVVSHVCLLLCSVSRICNNDLLNVNRSDAESFAPLDSAVPSLDFEQINVFWTSGFDSISLYLIHSLSAEGSLNCISRIRFRFPSSDLDWINICFMAFWFHYHCTVFRYELLNFSRRLSILCCSLNLDISSFEFE